MLLAQQLKYTSLRPRRLGDLSLSIHITNIAVLGLRGEMPSATVRAGIRMKMIRTMPTSICTNRTVRRPVLHQRVSGSHRVFLTILALCANILGGEETSGHNLDHNFYFCECSAAQSNSVFVVLATAIYSQE